MVLLNSLIERNPNDAEALYQRGRLHWRLGQRALAISDYSSSSLINPEGKATYALQQAQEIENFFNPDLLNP